MLLYMGTASVANQQQGISGGMLYDNIYIYECNSNDDDDDDWYYYT